MDKKEERKKYIAIIEELYPPDSTYLETGSLGREFMQWALQRFVDRYGWKNLDDAILKDMAYYCERHEKMMGLVKDK